MDNYVLKSYLMELKFVEQLKNNNNCELDILNYTDDLSHISGVFRFDNGREIPFETDIIKDDNFWAFKTIYQMNGRIFNEKDIFAVVKEKVSQYFNSKSNLLIHLVDNDIVKAYRVGKKYTLDRGISGSYGMMNMSNREVINQLNSYKQELENLNIKSSSIKK